MPFIVQDGEVSGVTLALGDDYRGIFWLVATPQATVEAIVAEADAPEVVPDLREQLFEPTTTQAELSATVDATSTTTLVDGEVAAESTPTTTAGTRGRAPEGEICG